MIRRRAGGPGPLRRAAAVLCAAGALAAGEQAVHAQEVFPRFAFQLEGAYLIHDDPRFNWVFDFGGDVDVVDWGRWRATFAAGYETIAGEQFRRFDLNQGTYLLEGALAFRVNGIEVGPVWHHVSRHLSDRLKRVPIDWNMIAFRARGSRRDAAVWQVNVRRTVTRAFVDYDWEVEGGVALSRRVSPRWAATAAGEARLVGVDGSRDRGTQAGGRIEGGVRLEGRGATGELFLAVERRVDPFPTGFGTAGWVTAGLRLRAR